MLDLFAAFSCSMMLSVDILEAKNDLAILADENIWDPVISDYTLCVVIVGVPTWHFKAKALAGCAAIAAEINGSFCM